MKGENRKMNIFQQLIKSLYSPKDIAKFRFQGIGKTIRYIFLLAFISIIPVIFQFMTFFSTSLTSVEESLKSKLPSFTIKDGTLTSDANQPVTINKDEITIIFDSTGEVKEETLDQHETTVAFLEHSFVVSNGGNVQASPYSMFDNLIITKEKVINFIDSIISLKWILVPVALFTLYLFTSGIMFLKITIFAIIGILLANVLRRNVSYRQSFRLTAYSATISTLFFTLMKMLKTYIPAASVLDWFVITVILFLVIKEIPQKRKS